MQLKIVFTILGLCAAVQETPTPNDPASGSQSEVAPIPSQAPSPAQSSASEPSEFAEIDNYSQGLLEVVQHQDSEEQRQQDARALSTWVNVICGLSDLGMAIYSWNRARKDAAVSAPDSVSDTHEKIKTELIKTAMVVFIVRFVCRVIFLFYICLTEKQIGHDITPEWYIYSFNGIQLVSLFWLVYRFECGIDTKHGTNRFGDVLQASQVKAEAEEAIGAILGFLLVVLPVVSSIGWAYQASNTPDQ